MMNDNFYDMWILDGLGNVELPLGIYIAESGEKYIIQAGSKSRNF